MKKKTKALALAMCAVLLVAGTMFATMAYLTSQDTVTNTFTVGKVAITLDEAKVDTAGVEESSADRVDTNAYHLIPGHTYTKDPTIHVAADSEDCWLFVKVENGIVDIEATGNNTIAKQMNANGWTLVDGETNIYAYRATVEKNENIPVFNSFKVAGDADVAGYASAEIKITAYAVQADGFDSAAAAWTAAGFTTPTTTD